MRALASGIKEEKRPEETKQTIDFNCQNHAFPECQLGMGVHKRTSAMVELLSSEFATVIHPSVLSGSTENSNCRLSVCGVGEARLLRTPWGMFRSSCVSLLVEPAHRF